MRALSVLTAYTEREYVGLECLWLEAMSALLLVIGMLNSCCEAKKLSESCAGIIGSIVLASLGVAAAVVIRLPCVPLHPEIAVEAAVPPGSARQWARTAHSRVECVRPVRRRHND